MRLRRWLAGLALAATCGCGALLDVDAYGVGPAPSLANQCPANALPRPDGTCVEVGVSDCGPVQVTPDAEGGCVTNLPAMCSGATLAHPGVIDCRAICEGPARGDLYVQPGGPLTTIAAALAAASPGQTIVLAHGSYHEDVVIEQAVTLRGECSPAAAIVGQGGEAAVLIEASEARLEQLVITGPAAGIRARGAELTVDEIYLHDTGGPGIELSAASGERPTATITRSVVEAATGAAILAEGYELTVETSHVRNTAARGDGLALGEGIVVRGGRYFVDERTPPLAGALTVRETLIERSGGAAIHVEGADAVVEDSAVRAMFLADEGEAIGLPAAGYGIVVARELGRAFAAPSSLALRRTVVTGAWGAAVRVVGASAELEDVVLESTRAKPEGPCAGHGVRVIGDAIGPASVAIRRSTVRDNAGAGLFVLGGQATLDGSIVRGTEPSPCGEAWGDGATVLSQPLGLAQGPDPSTLRVTDTLFDEHARTGVAAFDAVVALTGAVVQSTSIALAGVRYAPGDGQASFEPALQADVTSLCGPASALGGCALAPAELDPPLFARLADGARAPVVAVGGKVRANDTESLGSAVTWVLGRDELPAALTTNSAGDWLMTYVPQESQLVIAQHAADRFTEVRSLRTTNELFFYNANLLPLVFGSQAAALLGGQLDLSRATVLADMNAAGFAMDLAEAEIVAHQEQALVLQDDASGESTRLFGLGVPAGVVELGFHELESSAVGCTSLRDSHVQGLSQRRLQIPAFPGVFNTVEPRCTEL